MVEGLFHTYLYKCSSILLCSPTNLTNKNDTWHAQALLFDCLHINFLTDVQNGVKIHNKMLVFPPAPSYPLHSLQTSNNNVSISQI